MDSRNTSRPSASRSRSRQSTGRTSEDLVGGGEETGRGSDEFDYPGAAVSRTRASSAETQPQSLGLINAIKDRATTQLTTQKDRATDGIGTLANAVRQTTERLRSEQHDAVAQYVDRAAEQLERLSSRLREKDVNELLQDAQRFARRRPALFIGGSFAVGLLAARFLKSSRQPYSSAYDYVEPRGTIDTRAADLPRAY